MGVVACSNMYTFDGGGIIKSRIKGPNLQSNNIVTRLCLLRKLTTMGFDYDQPIPRTLASPRLCSIQHWYQNHITIYSDYSDIDPTLKFAHSSSRSHAISRSSQIATNGTNPLCFHPETTVRNTIQQQPLTTPPINLIFDYVVSYLHTTCAHLPVFGLPETHDLKKTAVPI
jgi:hypothetical protein